MSARRWVESVLLGGGGERGRRTLVVKHDLSRRKVLPTRRGNVDDARNELELCVITETDEQSA